MHFLLQNHYSHRSNFSSILLEFNSNIAKQKLLPQTELRQYKQFLKHPLPKFGWLLKKQTIKS